MKMKFKLQISINDLEQEAIGRANGRPLRRCDRKEARTFLFYVLKGGLSALTDSEIATRKEEILTGAGKTEHDQTPEEMGAEQVAEALKPKTSTVDGGSPPK